MGQNPAVMDITIDYYRFVPSVFQLSTVHKKVRSILKECQAAVETASSEAMVNLTPKPSHLSFTAAHAWMGAKSLVYQLFVSRHLLLELLLVWLVIDLGVLVILRMGSIISGMYQVG